ncbi:MAG: hypothetical protein H6707_17135 [Deltaproteobacteria bacterium]|nr:hypothetical protein [Deltaproteobacteria bacterium]
MSARLNIEIQELEEATLVKMSGVIDEDNELAQTVDRIKGPTVLVNAADVERINSCGIRDWVTWLGTIEDKAPTLYFLGCSPAIMTQVNLVNNFTGHGRIFNFYAPYFCSNCESDKMLLIDISTALRSKPFAAPTCRCNSCDHTMEFDDIESSYFAFLNTTEDASVDPKLSAVMTEITQSEQQQLRTRSMSMPMPSLSTSSFPSMPTTPSSKDLQGLLTEVSELSPGGVSSVDAMPAGARAGGSKNILLYLIVGLLVAAVGLLAYAVLRT